MPTLQELRQQPHISASQVSQYLRCPRAYFFKNIEQATPAFRPVCLAFGTAWHETID
jgi:hypothetical protein